MKFDDEIPENGTGDPTLPRLQGELEKLVLEDIAIEKAVANDGLASDLDQCHLIERNIQVCNDLLPKPR